MTDIFLSRPNWIPAEYEEGLSNFLRLLKSLDLNPRTIGTTDYPIDSPLDEVIEKMHNSKGVLILGYPQIVLQKGYLKDNAITSPVNLATEWNHIEASLAYAKKLPLLIIHDLGIGRGIFDRGAINKFIYEKDLNDNAWALSDEINGAINNWKTKIETYSSGEEYYSSFPIKSSNIYDNYSDLLSDESKTLLLEASRDKYASILKSSSKDGLSISTNNKLLNEKGNPRDESRWESALDELENYSLVKAANHKRHVFKVTNAGFEIADKLGGGVT